MTPHAFERWREILKWNAMSYREGPFQLAVPPLRGFLPLPAHLPKRNAPPRCAIVSNTTALLPTSMPLRVTVARSCPARTKIGFSSTLTTPGVRALTVTLVSCSSGREKYKLNSARCPRGTPIRRGRTSRPGTTIHDHAIGRHNISRAITRGRNHIEL